MSWRDDAACLGLDGDMFFPGVGGSTVRAKVICNVCTVKQPCLDYALKTGSHDGIWGGLSYRERLRYARKRRRAA
jgi:WhiB family redox-sensing transcriptional regulator